MSTWKPSLGPYASTVAQQYPAPKKGVVRGPSAGPGLPGEGAPGPTGQPLDPQYEAYLTQARYQRGLADAEAAYQTGQIRQEYGVEDQSNPYSRAALLKDTYEQAKRGTRNSLASSGQAHSGAAGRAQGANDRNYSIGYDQLVRQYQGAIHGVQYGQAQTIANYGTGQDQAAYEALIRALGGG